MKTRPLSIAGSRLLRTHVVLVQVNISSPNHITFYGFFVAFFWHIRYEKILCTHERRNGYGKMLNTGRKMGEKKSD